MKIYLVGSMDNQKQTWDKISTKTQRGDRQAMQLQAAQLQVPPLEKYAVYENAHRFLKQMETHLKFNEKTFSQIISLLDDYTKEKVDIVEVSSRLKVLLDGYPHVITDLNTFLPHAHKISVPLGDLRIPHYEYKHMLEVWFVSKQFNEVL